MERYYAHHPTPQMTNQLNEVIILSDKPKPVFKAVVWGASSIPIPIKTHRH